MSYNPLTALSQMCDDLIASGVHSERAEPSSEHRQHAHVSSNQFDLARTSGDCQRTRVQAGHVSSAQRQLGPERSKSSYGQGNHPEASDRKLELVIRKRQEKHHVVDPIEADLFLLNNDLNVNSMNMVSHPGSAKVELLTIFKCLTTILRSFYRIGCIFFDEVKQHTVGRWFNF